jgi:hypothetical protein
MTDTTVTPPAAPPAVTAVAVPAAPSFIQNLETSLSSEWSSAAAFLTQAEQVFGSFLTKVAAGAEVLITDIEAVGQYVAGHLTQITAGISVLSGVVTAIAPNSTAAAKVIADLTTSANDVALLSNALTVGSAASDPTIVTQAVTAIGAVKQLAQIAGNAGSVLTNIAAASPTATQAVSTPTPAAG